MTQKLKSRKLGMDPFAWWWVNTSISFRYEYHRIRIALHDFVSEIELLCCAAILVLWQINVNRCNIVHCVDDICKFEKLKMTQN